MIDNQFARKQKTHVERELENILSFLREKVVELKKFAYFCAVRKDSENGTDRAEGMEKSHV